MAKNEKASEGGRTRVELRFDSELHAKMKATAEEAGISLSQLIQGICNAAMHNAIHGIPDRSSGFVRAKAAEKRLFFGELGMQESEIEKYDAADRDVPPDSKGVVWFGLDFTGLGYVKY